ncbi:TspO/MBR family protein [Hoeflea olei]|uniref:Sensory protein TspO n=1 Tax=Hoeflea olei TaxID=1480615 RepID=A0A1C1YXI1_9HYPH|nr:TspO/MBR family protein [Hoeflea olei]OCW58139.1 sensory protein TspO [Hoeflea olei]
MSAIVIIIVVLATASSGAIFKPGEWYQHLRRPSWTPPNWAFPLVWSILYVAIGVSGWLLWQAQGLSLAMVVWGAQMVLNAAWSWLFFGLRRMDLAFVDVCAMFVLIALYIALVLPVSTIAALLFMPYAAWVIAAATLNRAVWRLNPEAVPG